MEIDSETVRRLDSEQASMVSKTQRLTVSTSHSLNKYLCLMFRKILYYLNPLTLFKNPEEDESSPFKKETGAVKPNFNLRVMHGINRISIFMFLLCLLILFFRYVL